MLGTGLTDGRALGDGTLLSAGLGEGRGDILLGTALGASEGKALDIATLGDCDRIDDTAEAMALCALGDWLSVYG